MRQIHAGRCERKIRPTVVEDLRETKRICTNRGSGRMVVVLMFYVVSRNTYVSICFFGFLGLRLQSVYVFIWFFWFFGFLRKFFMKIGMGLGRIWGLAQSWRLGGVVGLRNTCVFIRFFGFFRSGIANHMYFHLFFLFFGF